LVMFGSKATLALANNEAGVTPASAVVRALPRGGHVSLITTLHGLLALEEQWNKLELASKSSLSVFQSFSWISSWAKTHITENSKTEICVIIGFQEDRLVFALPLMKDQRGPVTVLRWLTEPYGQYGDALVAAGQNARTWLNSAMGFIKLLKDIDIVRLRHIRADSSMHDFCQTDMVDALLRERAPFLDLTAFPSDESYDARYTSTQRKRRKKIRKELEELGPIEFRILPNGALTDAAMAEAILEKNKWLDERGRQNRILKSPSHLAFLKNLSRAPDSGVEMVVSELRAGERPVSWEIGFKFKGVHFAYITSHVNALTDLSPGRLHMDLSQRHCIKHGEQKFDLMVPHDPHKESWSSACVETNDYYLPLTLTGRIFGQAYLRMLRPVIRKVYYKTPPAVLKIVKPLLGI
jgi:CelD/BcsL family acetyltransferase involved in cellulose biosynthesis